LKNERIKKKYINILKQNKNKKYNHIQISSVLGIYDQNNEKKLLELFKI
jgi:hypothetical protein